MKKRINKSIIRNLNVNVLLFVVIILSVLAVVHISLTGFAVQNQEQHSIGPSADEQSCMMKCMGCTSIGVGCTGDSATCQKQCNVEKPEETAETSCMETCVLKGCEQYDFNCQAKNQESCEKECNMLGDKPDESTMGAEQLCITNCVESEAPGTICGASQTGETGNELCQRCAASCVHLYAGPCLDDARLQARKNECPSCENCYAETIMGPSGEGWDCIVDVECKDASAEFGDNPGTGPGVGQEGFVANIGEGIGNIFEKIGNFISNLFGGNE